MQRIGVFIYTNRFQEQDPQYDGSIFIPAQCVITPSIWERFIGPK
ncbi:hypothetical protein [Nitrosospira multiformis]|nr:hypothetical protein [Nitrosospira multiformis]